MKQNSIEIKGNTYPFFLKRHVQTQFPEIYEAESFSNSDQLQQKAFLYKKMDGFKQLPFINLIKISQAGPFLHFFYQPILQSIQQHLLQLADQEKHHAMNKIMAKILIKRFSEQIGNIVSILAKLKIQTEFQYKNLGVKNGRLVYFVSCQSKFNKKSQMFLSALYKTLKIKAIKQLEKDITTIMCNKQTSEKSNLFSSQKLSNIKEISPNLENNQNYVEVPTFTKRGRRYSFNKYEDGNIQSDNLRKTQSPQLKNLHFKTNTSRQRKSSSQIQDGKAFKDYKFNQRKKYNFQEDAPNELKHSKSFKIQLQKDLSPSKKNRKDSYKVKIMECHQYEFDDISPQQFLSNNKQIRQIFQTISHQNQTKNQQHHNIEKEQNQESYTDTIDFNKYGVSSPVSTKTKKLRKMPTQNYDLKGQIKKSFDKDNLSRKVEQVKEKAQAAMLKIKKKMTFQ